MSNQPESYESFIQAQKIDHELGTVFNAAIFARLCLAQGYREQRSTITGHTIKIPFNSKDALALVANCMITDAPELADKVIDFKAEKLAREFDPYKDLN